jgi:TetR/AcrR family transcriptional regulator
VVQLADSSEQHGGAVTPLYERLPRGPHRMKRDEVAENQRQRMHGAMVEAVAAQGYGRTSVKQVISLAGVSRRAFYEQFANKQECFLSTLELIAGRTGELLGAAYRSGGPNIDQRMGAGLGALMELVASNPKSAHMALVDAPAAGQPGWALLTRTLLGFERIMFESFARSPGSSALPAGVVRGVTGGIHMVVLERVSKQRTGELPQLTADVLDWTLAAHSPVAARLAARTNGAQDRTARPSSANGAGAKTREEQATGTAHPAETALRAAGREPADERDLILQCTLDAIAEDGYGNLSPLGIVDRAEVSIDTFFGLFDDVEDCVLAALARLSEELLATLSAVDRRSSKPWTTQVRQALRSLADHLAARPSHALVIATGAPEMGPVGIDLSLSLAARVAHALIEGAPSVSSGSSSASSGAGGAVALEGVAGAVWHTVYCHAVQRRIETLPASVDQLAYVVLAPFVGAEQAVQGLLEEHPSGNLEPLSSELTRRSVKRGVSRAAL